MREHPASLLLPSMSDDEFAALKVDIKVNGLRAPIITFKGDLLDGRHRMRACEELGLSPTTREFKGDDPIAFVLSANLHRRHLTASQKAAIAVEAEALYADAAKERQLSTLRRGPVAATLQQRDEGGRALAKAAELTGASERNAHKVKRVKAADPVLYEKVRAGEVTANDAERRVAINSILSAPTVKPNGDGIDRTGTGVAERRQRIIEMADKGYTSDQIAASVGISGETVRKLARELGVTIVADAVLGRPRKVNSNRVVSETVTALEGLAMGVGLVEVDKLDPEQFEHWATSLSESLRSLNRLAKQLKEMARA